MNKRHIPFGLIIISLLFILIIRDLFRDGMFMDGLLYASVANNLANGLGSFWHPHFSQTVMPDFHEQPPLLFGIEAVFMKIFRNSIYAERIYGLLVVLISIFLIHKLWKCISQDRNEKNISWLPVLFWLCIPVCYWSYANNMEEPTMGMFDLGAMLFISKSIIQRNRTYLNLFLAALMLIAASMCKGFQGLFPLTAIFFYWVLFKNISFSKMLKNSIFILLVIVAFYGIILLNESVRSSYEMYFNNRIVGTFAHPAITHTDRLHIVKELFSELLPVIIIMFLGGIIIRIKKKDIALDKNSIRISLWFILIALSGTLPLMITMEQSGFYMVMAFPYYAIGFAILFAPFLSTHIEQINTDSKKYKIWTMFAWLIVASAVIFSVITIAYVPKREKEMLNDIYCIGPIITSGSIIGIPKEMDDDWHLYMYCSRYFNISLDVSSLRHKYFLLDKKWDRKLVPEGYKALNLPTQKYNLFIRNP